MSGGNSNGADRSRSEREGAFGSAVITAEARYSLVTKHYTLPALTPTTYPSRVPTTGAMDTVDFDDQGGRSAG